MPAALRLAVFLTLCCALFLRVAIPVGWMPASGAVFAIEPCPVVQAPPMNMADSHATGDHAPHKNQHSGECAFAPFHAAMAWPEQTTSDFASHSEALLLRSQSLLVPFATGPPALPPPATGPPATA